MSKHIFIFDTNTLLSAHLIKNSVSAKALDTALNLGKIAISESTFAEFTEVIFRKKFDKYLTNDDRIQIINKLAIEALSVSPQSKITDCRDEKDNKFLELAVEINATCIITGDADLLVLNPYKNLEIISAADFLEKYKSKLPS